MRLRVVAAIAPCVLAMAASSVARGSAAYFFSPHPAVVRIMAAERNGASFGSGALVAVTETHGLIVTNWHVIRDATGPITVFFPDGFHSGATVLRTDRDWDLAALAIWRPRAAPIAVSNQAPRPGEVLTIAGYGSGDYRAVAGRCTQYVSPGGNQPFEMVELDAPARNGDSGGPIINSRGELAGVLFGSAFGRTTGSYCGRLRWFLSSVGEDFRRMPSQTMIAQQQSQPASPVAAIPTTPSTASPSTRAGDNRAVASVLGGNSSALGAGGTQSPGRAATTWQPARETGTNRVATVAGPQTGPLPGAEQLKTIFAVIGVLAVLYQAARLLGSTIG